MYRTHSRHSYKPSNSSTSKFLDCFSASIYVLSMEFEKQHRDFKIFAKASAKNATTKPRPKQIAINLQDRYSLKKTCEQNVERKSCLLHDIPLKFPPVRSQMHARNGIQTPAISSKFHHNNPGHRRHQTLVNTARLWRRSYYGIIATTMIDCKSFTSKKKKKSAVNIHTHTNSKQTAFSYPFPEPIPHQIVRLMERSEAVAPRYAAVLIER